ncbi:MAG: 4Fe-4S cluster-binding domain-containing protein [Bacteroidales bacterium]|nr:4Fe-4S cluster-binding domain-containing protein [Bacteroidales bacterium]
MIVNHLTESLGYTDDDRELLSSCRLCPRECGADRFSEASGYCRTDAGINVASVVVHKGEEPAVSGPEGICNVFFYGCNMRCIYCQNHQISNPAAERSGSLNDLNDVADRIVKILDSGVPSVGFVSPSHVVPQVKLIIRELNRQGYRPVTVYNTNSYEKAYTIRQLDGLIDVYLADFKYAEGEIAKKLSDTADYPTVALKAIREMYFQKGSTLITDDEGRAVSGLIIRHLVLPGYADASINAIRMIADEVSPGVTISLMSQYYPAFRAEGEPDLGRSLEKEEYEKVRQECEKAGFRKGWYQEQGSSRIYRPDFRRADPFAEEEGKAVK